MTIARPQTEARQRGRRIPHALLAATVALATVAGSVVGSAPAQASIQGHHLEVVTERDQTVTMDFSKLVRDSENPGFDPKDATYEVEMISSGEAVHHGQGVVTFTPDAGYTGLAAMSVEACYEGDCAGSGTSIFVEHPDDIWEEATPHNTAVSFIPKDILADSFFAIFPDAGAYLNNTLAHGSVSMDGDEWTYTPDDGWHGDEWLSVQLCMDRTCQVEVMRVHTMPDGPIAEDAERTVEEDGEFTIDLSSLISEAGDGILIEENPSLATAPANGELSGVGTGSSWTYTPNPDYWGDDSFEYQICDTDDRCATGQIDITVTGVNDAPFAGDIFLTTDEDTPQEFFPESHTTEVDGDPLTITISEPEHGTVTPNGGTAMLYTPDPDYWGSDEFTYQACDAEPLCDEGTIEVTVNPINDPVIAVDDFFEIDEDGAIEVAALFANDIEVDGAALLLIGLDTSTVVGDVTVDPAGNLTYYPLADWSGTETFTYAVDVLTGPSASATVTIVVNPVNDAPEIADQAMATDTRSPVVIPVSTEIVDVDIPYGDTHTVALDSTPANGTAVIEENGDITYTADEWFVGEDQFEVIVTDSEGETARSVVSIEISAPVEPVIETIKGKLSEGGSYTHHLLNRFELMSSPDAGPHSLMASTAGALFGTLAVPGFSFEVSAVPVHGSLEFAQSTVTYTPAPFYNGSDSFEVKVCASSGVCELHAVSLDVTSVPDAPWLIDPATAGEKVPPALDTIEVSLTVGGTLSELTVFNPDGTPYEVRLTDGALPAGVSLNADGSFLGATTTVGLYEASLEVCNTEAGLCTTTAFAVTVLAAEENLSHTGPTTDGWGMLALMLAGVGVMLVFLGRSPKGQGQG